MSGLWHVCAKGLSWLSLGSHTASSLQTRGLAPEQPQSSPHTWGSLSLLRLWPPPSLHLARGLPGENKPPPGRSPTLPEPQEKQHTGTLTDAPARRLQRLAGTGAGLWPFLGLGARSGWFRLADGLWARAPLQSLFLPSLGFCLHGLCEGFAPFCTGAQQMLLVAASNTLRWQRQPAALGLR